MSSSTYLPLRFAFLFSLSLAGASASASFTKTRLNLFNADALSPPSEPKATASDLLSLLGTPQQSCSVNSQVAQQIWSCFKFLVPFPPYSQTLATGRSLSSNTNSSSDRSGKDIDDMILSPPEPVLELARLAVNSGADPGAIQRTLDPTILPVPDVEGSNEERCELTRTPYGRRFINEEVNSYLEFLFKVIVERGPSVGLNVSLSRYDLFHGHLFLAADSGRLGILFHAREYPAYDKEVFPLNMGYCQVGSNVAYDDSMNLRNILWLAPFPSNSTKAWLAPGILVVLDAHPAGIIYQDLIPDYVQIARTLYEDDFGELVVDVNYLNVGTDVPKYEVFLC
ncbi:T-box protein 41 [Dorcoceras hygrometricum]|nr:T-box protein 41 [Dorcoceras hygrometricum]